MLAFSPKEEKMNNNFSKFNIIISGVGGQGLITLLRIITLAALKEGYDVKTSELHGLSQRGGSVEVHLRFGRKIWSPLVRKGGANLIISLEFQEALRASFYSSKEAKTIFLINNNFVPIPNKALLTPEEILKNLKKISENVFLIPASDIGKKEVGTDVVAGIYILGCAVFKKIIPLAPDSIISAIKKTIPEKYSDMNLKIFNLAKSKQ